MLSVDRDAVICDLAETYHVLDYRSLPIMTLATLCAGLRPDSRIMMKMAGVKEIASSILTVHIADALTLILHSLTGDKTRPKLYEEVMTGKQVKTNGFDSIEEFEAARRGFIHGN
jgi:hypothetical protein